MCPQSLRLSEKAQKKDGEKVYPWLHDSISVLGRGLMLARPLEALDYAFGAKRPCGRIAGWKALPERLVDSLIVRQAIGP
jgi:hypothetical protein